jgi:hypothetical protein
MKLVKYSPYIHLSGCALLIAGALFISWLTATRSASTKAFAVAQCFTIRPGPDDAFSLSYMTAKFVTLEGGTYGGIISGQPITEIQRINPAIRGYAPESSSILWLYKCRPTYIEKTTPKFGASALTVRDIPAAPDQIYIAVIPRSLSASIDHIDCEIRMP